MEIQLHSFLISTLVVRVQPHSNTTVPPGKEGSLTIAEHFLTSWRQKITSDSHGTTIILCICGLFNKAVSFFLSQFQPLSTLPLQVYWVIVACKHTQWHPHTRRESSGRVQEGRTGPYMEQNTALRRDKYLYTRRDSNPHFQQANGHIPMIQNGIGAVSINTITLCSLFDLNWEIFVWNFFSKFLYWRNKFQTALCLPCFR